MSYVKKILSCLLAATSVFGFCAFSYTSSAAEASEQQSVQESGEAKNTAEVSGQENVQKLEGAKNTVEVSEQQNVQESGEANDAQKSNQWLVIGVVRTRVLILLSKASAGNPPSIGVCHV